MSKLPIEAFTFDNPLLNQPTLVAYEGRPPQKRMNDTLGTTDFDTISDTRLYIRCVRRHTAQSDERLEIVDTDSAYYHESFENMEIGEERLL